MREEARRQEERIRGIVSQLTEGAEREAARVLSHLQDTARTSHDASSRETLAPLESAAKEALRKLILRHVSGWCLVGTPKEAYGTCVPPNPIQM